MGRPKGHLSTTFRITAAPTAAAFDLGRLYGRDELVGLRQRFPISLEGGQTEACAVRPSGRARPIVRAVRLTHDGTDGPVQLDVHSGGTGDLGCRVSPRDGDHLFALSWTVAYAANVLLAADDLRTAAGQSGCEHDVELEIRGSPDGGPPNLLGYNEGAFRGDRVGDGLWRLPLLLPRLLRHRGGTRVGFGNDARRRVRRRRAAPPGILPPGRRPSASVMTTGALFSR